MDFCIRLFNLIGEFKCASRELVKVGNNRFVVDYYFCFVGFGEKSSVKGIFIFEVIV
ncbi:hypothetical protein GCM10008107_06060 [Psychrosphaera saromensis]|nr:hypothetical protein GCM10008107_06060 [Psychrosphaera saromensis]GLQ14327.1 hypothetical protein GCM10007917_17820 [Psychrosphaera saromensis]